MGIKKQTVGKGSFVQTKGSLFFLALLTSIFFFTQPARPSERRTFRDSRGHAAPISLKDQLLRQQDQIHELQLQLLKLRQKTEQEHLQRQTQSQQPPPVAPPSTPPLSQSTSASPPPRFVQWQKRRVQQVQHHSSRSSRPRQDPQAQGRKRKKRRQSASHREQPHSRLSSQSTSSMTSGHRAAILWIRVRAHEYDRYVREEQIGPPLSQQLSEEQKMNYIFLERAKEDDDGLPSPSFSSLTFSRGDSQAHPIDLTDVSSFPERLERDLQSTQAPSSQCGHPASDEPEILSPVPIRRGTHRQAQRPPSPQKSDSCARSLSPLSQETSYRRSLSSEKINQDFAPFSGKMPPSNLPYTSKRRLGSSPVILISPLPGTIQRPFGVEEDLLHSDSFSENKRATDTRRHPSPPPSDAAEASKTTTPWASPLFSFDEEIAGSFAYW